MQCCCRLHLREGLRSYHANGYLVALNYPELTGDRLLTGLSSLPITQQLQLIQELKVRRISATLDSQSRCAVGMFVCIDLCVTAHGYKHQKADY